jgi:polyhydroxybutyrate depolymerase
MRRALMAMAAAMALGAGGASACPGTDGACETAHGDYHILTPTRAKPAVVLFLHGYGGTGSGVVGNREFAAQILSRGYALIAPQGMPRRPGDTGGSWNASADPARRDDVAFLREALDDAAARFGLDRDHVLAAGFSGGGMMVWRLACDAPDSTSAYAPIAGLMWRPLPATCAGPVRLLHTHGWSDPVVPLEGRSVAGGRITQGDLFEGLNLLREANRCAKDNPDAYDVVGQFQRRMWTDCAPDSDLIFALYPGGHRIPEGWVAMALDWFEAIEPERTTN